MTNKKDKQGKLLPDEQRLTSYGSFLRSTSIDELPELVNILKGDMSIIGPRPLLVKYLPLYNEYQKHRHDVHPGLTGYAQVNGRNTLSWEEKFDMDVKYVQHITFVEDVKIFLNTVFKVLKEMEYLLRRLRRWKNLREINMTRSKNKQSVVIIGASGHGKVVADIIACIGDEIKGFLDDNSNLNGTFIGFPVLGKIDEFWKFSECRFIVAIGNAAIRERITQKLSQVQLVYRNSSDGGCFFYGYIYRRRNSGNG